jgi:hypothetical protein
MKRTEIVSGEAEMTVERLGLIVLLPLVVVLVLVYLSLPLWVVGLCVGFGVIVAAWLLFSGKAS